MKRHMVLLAGTAVAAMVAGGAVLAVQSGAHASAAKPSGHGSAATAKPSGHESAAKPSGHASAATAKPSGHGAGAPAPSGPKAHWGYSGNQGPKNWGNLSTAYVLCKDGQMQSPVDISQTQSAGMAELKLDYLATPLSIVNNGHTIQVNYRPGSHLVSGQHSYKLLQFHFHTPSENTTNGRPYAMEMHLVHRDAEGQLGVVAVFFKEGGSNIALQEIWNHLPKDVNKETHIDGIVVNAHDLLPRSQDYYRFVGSLTTPPCSEGVQWYVFKEPVEASRQQIQAFSALIGNNARPVQPVGHRLVIDSASKSGGH